MTDEFTGHWRNQNGSLLHLEVDEAGAVSGWFESRKGRAAQGKRYPVRGVANGVLIAFAVDFRLDDENLASITNFSGRYARSVDGTEEIHTLWVLARRFEDSERTKPTQPWNSFLVNSDVFRREV